MIARTPEQEEANLREIIESRTFPGVIGFTDRGTAAVEEKIYREHNITHTHRDRNGDIKAIPNRDGEQCQCGDCGSHRKRNAVTGVAKPDKKITEEMKCQNG